MSSCSYGKIVFHIPCALRPCVKLLVYGEHVNTRGAIKAQARVLACLQVVVRSASCQRTKSFSTLKEVTGSALYLAGGVAVPAAPSLRAIALRRMRPRSPNRFGREVLTSHIETCWSRGIKLTRLYVGSSLALRLTSSSDRTPAHRSPFARPVLLIVCRFLYDLAPFS